MENAGFHICSPARQQTHHINYIHAVQHKHTFEEEFVSVGEH